MITVFYQFLSSDVAICAARYLRLKQQHHLISSLKQDLTQVSLLHTIVQVNLHVDIKGDAGVDDKVVTLGPMVVTALHSFVATSNASASLDAGANWSPGEAASYTVTDPDMNRMASSR